MWSGKNLLRVYKTRSELRRGGRRKKGENNKWDENEQLLLGEGIVHWTTLSYVLKVTVSVRYSAPHNLVMRDLRKIRCCPSTLAWVGGGYEFDRTEADVTDGTCGVVNGSWICRSLVIGVGGNNICHGKGTTFDHKTSHTSGRSLSP